MSRGTRTLLICLAAIIFIGSCFCVGTTALITASGVGFAVAGAIPQRAAAVAADIAQFDIPAGYRLAYGVRLFGLSAISIENSSHRGSITLVRLPGWLPFSSYDVERWARYSHLNVGGGDDEDEDFYWRHDGTMQTSIRSQNVTLHLGEGEDRQGQVYRSASGVFMGRGGLTVISIVLPQYEWDQAMVKGFLASIR